MSNPAVVQGRWDSWIALALIALVTTIHLPALLTPPFVADTLGAIDQALKSNAEIWLEPTSTANGFYRPLSFWTLKIQVDLLGVHMPLLWATNLVLLSAAFFVMHKVACRLGATPLVAAVTLLVIAGDGVWQVPMFWLSDRQALLATLFGWLAVLALLRRPDAWGALCAGIALVAATLSKETAYAYVPTLLWLAWAHVERPLPKLALIAALALAALCWRIWIVGGMFGGRLAASPDIAMVDRVAEYAWNIFANFLGILYRPLFDSVGAFDPSRPLAARGNWVFVFLALLAIAAVKLRPRAAVPLLLMIAGNALVMFVEYRARNHMPGFAAIGMLAALTLTAASDHRPRVAAAIAMICAVVFIAGVGRSIRAYDAAASTILANEPNLAPSADLRASLIDTVRMHCLASSRWCVIDLASLGAGTLHRANSR